MEAKKLFIAAVLIILIVACSFIPFNNKREIVIKAQLYDVAKQINNLNNWKKWNSDLDDSNIKISGDYSTDQKAALNSGQYYELHHINPLEVSLIRNLSDASTSSIIAISASANDSSTYVAWTETVTIYKLIERSFTKINSRQSNLNSLKEMMENINYKYGFFIKIVPVKDTLILTAEASLLNDSDNIVTKLYHTLQSFIIQNKLPYETKYFYKTVLNNDKIAVGIPVYKKISNTNNIKFLELPANGRLVEGNYSGKISGKQSIYNSINSFMFDQHLKQVAKPLEQYNVADTSLNANNNADIKIYFPVF